MSLTVKDMMTKDMITVPPSASAATVAKIFIEHKFGSIPVVDSNKLLLGQIAIREFFTIFLPTYIDLIDSFTFVDDFGALERIFVEGPILELFVAEDLMNPNPFVVTEQASLFKVAALMDRHNTRQLLVADADGKLSGIVTMFDIFKVLMKDKL